MRISIAGLVSFISVAPRCLCHTTMPSDTGLSLGSKYSDPTLLVLLIVPSVGRARASLIFSRGKGGFDGSIPVTTDFAVTAPISTRIAIRIPTSCLAESYATQWTPLSSRRFSPGSSDTLAIRE